MHMVKPSKDISTQKDFLRFKYLFCCTGYMVIFLVVYFKIQLFLIIWIKSQYLYLKILHLSIQVKVTVKTYLVFLRKNAFEFAMQTPFGYIVVLNLFSLKTRHKLSLKIEQDWKYI